MVTDLYSAREIALAAGVPESEVEQVVPPAAFVPHAEAVRIGAALVLARRGAAAPQPAPLFTVFSGASAGLRSPRVFALSSTLHATMLAVVVFIATFNLAPRAAVLLQEEHPTELMRLVFLATPGPGGGAGTGSGTGLGSGAGSGVGPGTGGGTGGGPYRPGSGIEPPRLLREVKADYTEDARLRRLTGDVVMEIVV